MSATDAIERDISSIAAAVSVTELAQLSVSWLIVLVVGGHLRDRRRDLLRRRGHLRGRRAHRLDRRRWSPGRGGGFGDRVARLAVLAVTCSIDAAISLTTRRVPRSDAATDSACDAVSFSERAISLTPLTASSSERICASAPSATRVGDARDAAGRGGHARARCAHGGRMSTMCALPLPLPAPLRLVWSALPCPALLLPSLREADVGLGKIQNAIEIQNENQPIAHRRRCRPRSVRSSRSTPRRRLNRVGGMLTNSRATSTSRPISAVARLHDDQPACAGRRARARTRSARAG